MVKTGSNGNFPIGQAYVFDIPNSWYVEHRIFGSIKGMCRRYRVIGWYTRSTPRANEGHNLRNYRGVYFHIPFSSYKWSSQGGNEDSPWKILGISIYWLVINCNIRGHENIFPKWITQRQGCRPQYIWGGSEVYELLSEIYQAWRIQ